MVVKIGDKIYDPNKQPIMLILTEQDKQNIANMHPGATKLCAYPSGMSTEEIEKFMMEEQNAT